MNQLEKTLKALANRRRLTLLIFLKKHPWTPVHELSERLKYSYKATSKHLRVLRNADIVECRQEVFEVWYRIVQEPPEAARRILSLL